ncbi:hypothetical protein CYMTET_23217 [Cymbomonas tetramitiformis]|uniref:J domain-containing protein n=1 Tax=Cymbomonas tetramitiformis TaxID=36881 RepID=A0AAE0FYM3_9CHLO|nr:hypothetical protein CYMTET_23217 [Cymbomonas tetramitiformis]
MSTYESPSLFDLGPRRGRDARSMFPNMGQVKVPTHAAHPPPGAPPAAPLNIPSQESLKSPRRSRSTMRVRTPTICPRDKLKIYQASRYTGRENRGAKETQSARYPAENSAQPPDAGPATARPDYSIPTSGAKFGRRGASVAQQSNLADAQPSHLNGKGPYRSDVGATNLFQEHVLRDRSRVQVRNNLPAEESNFSKANSGIAADFHQRRAEAQQRTSNEAVRKDKKNLPFHEWLEKNEDITSPKASRRTESIFQDATDAKTNPVDSKYRRRREWEHHTYQKNRSARNSSSQYSSNVEAFMECERAWAAFESSPPEIITAEQVPCPAVPEGILAAGMAADTHPSADDFTKLRKVYRSLSLRWHPDKFRQAFGQKLDGAQETVILAKVQQVSQQLNDEYSSLQRSIKNTIAFGS